MDNKSLFLSLLFILFWNSGFIGAEFALPYVGPFTLLFWRYLALTILILLFLLIRKRFTWPGWKSVLLSMLTGILAHGVYLACVLIALQNGVPAGIVAMVVALQPMATGSFSGIVTGERVHSYQWLGLLIGLIGVISTLICRIDFSSYHSIVGYLIPLGSVFGITLAALLQRRLELKGGKHVLPLDLCLFY